MATAVSGLLVELGVVRDYDTSFVTRLFHMATGID